MEDKENQAKFHEADVPAIVVQNVEKIYKLYDKPRDRMKEAFGFGKSRITSCIMP